ncbi:MAG: KEOPS complex subunit Pcc1 [Haloarculaceae archaeon]
MRRARLRTTHGDTATAERIAAALAPDNTAEMDTRVEGDAVVTTVERGTTGGLQSTVDDYVVNLRVAARLADDASHANRPTDNDT